MHRNVSRLTGLATHPSAILAGKILLRVMLCVVLPLGLTYFAWRNATENLQDRARSDFEALVIESEKALLNRVASYRHVLHGAAGLLQGSAQVTRAEWRAYEQALDIGANFPGMRGIGYIQEVAADDVEPFLAEVRKDGTPDFAIHPPTVGKPLFITRFYEPLAEGEHVLGLNIAFEAHRLEAAIRARDTGLPAITRRVFLVQDRTYSPGFLLLHPVYRYGVPLETIQDRRAAFRGWIYSNFIGPGLLSELTQSQQHMLELTVYDGTERRPDSLIYSSSRTPASSQAAFSLAKQRRIMQQTWTLVWTSTRSFEAAHQSNEPIMVVLRGLMLSAGITLFVLMSLRRAKTVERLVVVKTKEIAANEKRLKLLIRHTPAAVAMFDKEMRYIATSDRWLRDYGLEGRDILGKSHYEIFPEILGNPDWLDHHRRALKGESLSRDDDRWERSDGRADWIKWALHPWLDAENEIGGLVMFTEVITERKEAERRSELLREVATEAAEAPTVTAVLDVSLGKMCEYLRWPIAHGYCWRAEKQFQDAEQVWHTENVERVYPETYRSSEAIAFALKNRLVGHVIAGGKPILIVAPAAPRSGRFFFQSCLGIPVFVGHRIAAILEFFSPDIAVHDKALLELCELVALQISRVIERKEAEAALKESEERYERAVQGSSVGLWEWDLRLDTMFWSARFMTIAGKAPQNFTSETRMFRQLLHPDDRARIRDAIIAHLKRYAPFDVEYRLLHADGGYRWIHSRGQASWDENGRAVLMAGSADDITSRKRTKSALEESNRLNTAILASTTSLVIATDPVGKVALFNKAAETALGYAAGEVVGNVLPQVWEADEMARRAAQLTREFSRLIDPGFEVFVHKARLSGADRQEWMFVRKDGTRFPASMTATPLIGASGQIDGFLAMIDDITERLAQQEALREREARLSNIIDKAVDGLIVIDEHGTIEAFNPAAARMFGYAAADVMGRNILMLMPQRFQAGHAAALKRSRENPSFRPAEIVHELMGKRSDGTEFPIDLSISNVSLSGRRIFSGIIRDISSRKETEHTLIAYAAELERSNRELDDFAYVASHDLKAPLRVINNASRWLEEDLAPHMSAEDRMNMEMLRGRVQRMEKLLDDLLEYSRVGRSSDDRFAEVVNGRALMDDILLLLAPPPGFTVEVTPGFAAIEVNRMPLQQVIYNLIGNAIKHHHRSDGLIRVSVEDSGEMYTFTVQDDGPGIPERFHEQVFKMFQTLKPRDQVEGSGMGLAFVKKNVSYFGGEVRLVSEEGKGAAFSFTWPKQQKPVGVLQWKAA